MTLTSQPYQLQQARAMSTPIRSEIAGNRYEQDHLRSACIIIVAHPRAEEFERSTTARLRRILAIFKIAHQLVVVRAARSTAPSLLFLLTRSTPVGVLFVVVFRTHSDLVEEENSVESDWRFSACARGKKAGRREHRCELPLRN